MKSRAYVSRVTLFGFKLPVAEYVIENPNSEHVKNLLKSVRFVFRPFCKVAWIPLKKANDALGE